MSRNQGNSQTVNQGNERDSSRNVHHVENKEQNNSSFHNHNQQQFPSLKFPVMPIIGCRLYAGKDACIA